MHLLLDQLVHLPAEAFLESAVLLIILPLKTLAELLMLTYDAFHLRMGPLHLLLHARDLSLDRAKLSLGLLELGL